jgi:hypothetical protein
VTRNSAARRCTGPACPRSAGPIWLRGTNARASPHGDLEAALVHRQHQPLDGHAARPALGEHGQRPRALAQVRLRMTPFAPASTTCASTVSPTPNTKDALRRPSARAGRSIASVRPERVRNAVSAPAEIWSR